MNQYIALILPALLTVGLNILFYLYIKKTVDNSIEKFKITYSGIFREKIDIYKQLLTIVHDLKLKLNQFQYYHTDEFKSEIQADFNKLIKIYLVNRPFLSQQLVDLFKSNTKLLQEIFESLTLGRLSNFVNLSQNEIKIREKSYWEAVNKLRENKTLAVIEDRIILEMKKDLHNE